jgi:hypothetical protein
MNKIIVAGAMALAVIGTAVANAAPVPDRAPGIIPPTTASAPVDPAPVRDWVEDISGKTLTAVDGSTLALVSSEEGLARHIVSAAGDAQDTSFTFINRNLGTVNEGPDTVGFFRRDGDGFDITYEDGRTETIASTPDGGVTIRLNTPDNGAHCMGWYPQGHAFNDSEKRAALAMYAKKLGLATPGTGNAVPLDSCTPATTTADAKLEPINPVAAAPAPAATPIVKSTTAKKRGKKTAELTPTPTPVALASASAGSLAPLTAVPVRDSEVHAVNDGGEELAAVTSDPGHGASSCLSVDSDGDHWGFRNHCRFDVEFAYCLKNAGTDIASCDQGPESGLVAANGFTPLIRSTALGGNEAERDFRWVGCGLVAGPLQAKLEQTSPPAGRCVAPSTAS